MKTQTLVVLGMFAVALLSFPAPTSAQGCYECDWIECVDADWHGHGWTQCEVVESECVFDGDVCWGPDPEMSVIFVRADGTYFVPAPAEASLTPSMVSAVAELATTLPVGRSYERNCKGLITRRIYGEAEIAELARRTKHLTI